MQHTIRRLVDADVEAVVAFSLAAWEPVFASLEAALSPEIYCLLFPDWRSTQARAVEATCQAPENEVWLAIVDDRPVGFVAIGFVDEDAARAGEINMIAVDPACQGAGIATALLQQALTAIKASGVELAVVSTGGDLGHAPARALYDKLGFTPLPLVRYYRTL